MPNSEAILAHDHAQALSSLLAERLKLRAEQRRLIYEACRVALESYAEKSGLHRIAAPSDN